MAAENPRQETEFTVCGRTFRVRPTWRTIVAVEAATGQSAHVLGQKILRFEASLLEIGAVVVVLVQGEKNPPTRDEIGESLVDDGWADLVVPLGTFLTRAIRGNKEHEKEAAEARLDPQPETAEA